MEPVEAPGISYKAGPLRLEHLPDRSITQLGVVMCLGIRNALVKQPDIQFLIALHPQPWGKEALPHQPDLVLDLPLLPTRCRGTRHRIDQVVAAHLEKAAVVGALAADEDRLHRRLHVVVDAARAGPFEKGKRPVVRVEHHLLRLARIPPDEWRPAVAQPNMCHLHCYRRAVDQHDLLAPVELIRLASGEAQRNEGTYRRRRPTALPLPRIPPHRVIAALVAELTQRFEHPDQCQPLATRLALVRRQQTIKCVLPGADPRQWLLTALVAKLRRIRSNNLSHHLPRNPQLTADRLDRLPLSKICSADLRNRLHDQHPDQGPHSPREPS